MGTLVHPLPCRFCGEPAEYLCDECVAAFCSDCAPNRDDDAPVDVCTECIEEDCEPLATDKFQQWLRSHGEFCIDD